MIPEFDSKTLAKIAFQKVSKASLAASIAIKMKLSIKDISNTIHAHH